MYSFSSRVRYSECDAEGRLTLTGAMNYLQDCSTFQSESLGLSLRGYRERGLGWILASWYVEFDEDLPRFTDDITVSTWCYDLGRLRAQRSFCIEDVSGRMPVRADSEWFLYDLDAKRVVRVPEEEQAYRSGEPRLDLPKMERKIRLEGEGREASPITVSELHLDSNGHVNNAQYVLFAQAAMAELGLEVPVRRLHAQYRRMAWLGDVIVPVVRPCDGGCTVELADQEREPFAIVKIQEA